MPLNAPNLDSRTFDDLVKEARERIPRYTPEWTNLNDSDPGMTLVKLNAWLTETILFELNRVPDLTYTKFLDLLQITRRPAHAARSELAVTLKKLSTPEDALSVLVPKGAKVEVDDPDLTEEVLFETDYSLRAINAAIGACMVSRAGAHPLDLVTEYDSKTAATDWRPGFLPFGEAPVANATMLLGLVLRPHIKGSLNDYAQDVFPSGQIDIFVDASQPFDTVEGTDTNGTPTEEVIDTSLSRQCLFPWEVSEAVRQVEWQVYTGSSPDTEITGNGSSSTGWVTLSVAGDETAGLTRSGHVRLEIPERIGRASMDQLDRDAIWENLGLAQVRPPVTEDELLADLDQDLEGLLDALDEDAWQNMGLTDTQDLNRVLSCDPTAATQNCKTGADVADQIRDNNLDVDPSALTPQEWRKLAADAYALPPVPVFAETTRRLHWLRAVLRDPSDYTPAPLAEIRLNTIPATGASTRLDERLGASDGRPGQTLTLARVPVYFDPESGAPDAEITVGGESWTRVDDFFRSQPGDPHYTLDPTTGVVTFGDGKRGRIPVAGAEIRVVRYRTGGGAIGNVGPGTITKLRGAIRDVDTVTNPRAAAGGSDAESDDDVRLRAPHTLRVRDRAVSAEDFAFLARQTPGVAVHKAYAVAGHDYDRDRTPKLDAQPGAVTVIVLPANDEDTPLASEAELRAVCRYLEPRRLITTELHVASPDYADLSSLKARITIGQDADIKTVSDAAIAAVLTFLHPLRGGAAGDGWPFGEPIYHADLYDLLLGVDGVRRVSNLSIARADGGDTDPVADVLGLPKGMLPHLPREAIEFQVTYDSFG
ncbi:putative baseplate assembly protein [Fluviibacterium sp. DFM31]|uniref:Baseplate assembly protein n=1 Tax=Meridianimarinicoccus marinus TaxID=3231483 RepID=A0ABV3L7A4_9RHOB